MANLADDDLLLVQRTSAGISTNYSITGSALKEDLTGVTGLIANPVEVLTPLDGSGLSGDISYYPETSAVTNAAPVQSVHDLGTNFIEVGNAYFQTGTKANLYDSFTSTAYGITGMSVYDAGQLIYIRFSNDYDGTTSVFKSGAAVDFRIYCISTMTVHVELHYNDGTVEYSNQSSGHGHLIFTTKPKPLSLGIIKSISGGSVNNAEIKIPQIWIGQPLPDPYDPNLITTQKITLDGPTVLTLTNDKVFDSSNGTEMSTVDQVLTEGTVVEGPAGADVAAFNTTLYSGDSVMNRAITTGIDNTGDSLIWVKNRNTSGYVHVLSGQHILNGGFTNSNSQSITNIWTNSNAQGDQSTNYITGVLDNGFTIGNSGHVNDPGQNYVAWNFRELPGFLDIVTFSGDGVNGRAVPHNLGTAPGFIMLKNLTYNENWMCYHKDAALDGYLAAHERFLQINYDTIPFPNSTSSSPSPAWGNTAPDENNFYLSGSVNSNSSGSDFVAYLFADVPGRIKCGTYTGTGGNNTIDAGFTGGCAWAMVKNISNAGDWSISDSERISGNGHLYPNNHDWEDSSSSFHVNDNGFHLSDNNVNWNASGDKYIYVAIASNAMAPELGPTGTLTADADASTPSMTLSNVTGTWTSGTTAVGRTQLTEYAPGPDDITFTSTNAGTTPFNGTDATLAFRRWTLESRASAGDPWVVVDTYEDYDITVSQDGATPWSSNKPTLSPNTMYRVKVAYISTNADPVESVYNTFTTGSN